jgi:hypothetical protein
MFASIKTFPPPENLNIPHIQIPQPTECCAANAPVSNTIPVYVPPLGSPRPVKNGASYSVLQKDGLQRRHGAFTFPSPDPTVASSTTSSIALSNAVSVASAASSAASVAISIPSPTSAATSPLARPNKCRRITTNFLDYCRVCEISLLNVAHGIYADVCKSCEDIQHRFRKGTSFPACFICYCDAYHIHRNCNQAICKRCLRQHTLCPSCKLPIDKQ